MALGLLRSGNRVDRLSPQGIQCACVPHPVRPSAEFGSLLSHCAQSVIAAEPPGATFYRNVDVT
jgi:hypothetical protein